MKLIRTQERFKHPFVFKLALGKLFGNQDGETIKKFIKKQKQKVYGSENKLLIIFLLNVPD